MKKKLYFTVVFIICLSGCKKVVEETPVQVITSKPSVSFTFDDGITSDILDFKFEEWNQMILSTLEQAELKAGFFVTGSNKLNEKGKFLLKSWDEQGHFIGNHTFTHPFFNAEHNSAALFEQELLRTDAIISSYKHYKKVFRFPYLKEGQSSAKVDSIRNILAKLKYKNGYVTIDASDWYVNTRLIKKIKQVGMDSILIEKYKNFYVQHIMERAHYYEQLSFELNNRHIKHTLLLHHNLTSALFLEDLISEFKKQGWEVTNADEAFRDIVFQQVPDSEYAGESLIWSMAKQSGKYEQSLRYPAEDSRYEAPKMDKLGL